MAHRVGERVTVGHRLTEPLLLREALGVTLRVRAPVGRVREAVALTLAEGQRVPDRVGEGVAEAERMAEAVTAAAGCKRSSREAAARRGAAGMASSGVEGQRLA